MNLASTLGDWSAKGTWIGEFAPEGAQDAVTAAADAQADLAVESAGLPTISVGQRPLVRSLNQLSETVIEERGPAVEVKRQAFLAELPLQDASEVAEFAQAQSVPSADRTVDSREGIGLTRR